MEYLSSREIGKRWGVSARRVTELCKAGRIAGARMSNGTWAIPADAPKPGDGRSSNGRGRRSQRSSGRKPLPVGVSLYEQAATHYEYVDKTLLVKDLLDAARPVTLFLRPRRFGKSLNMDMLRCFFEKSDDDTAGLFRDKLIWKKGARYTSEQGRYPVIYLSFKDAKAPTWDLAYAHIKQLIATEYRRHPELGASDALDEIDRGIYGLIARRAASDADWVSSLATLADLLHKHHGIAPVILIDEYDTPVQQGHTCGFYDEIIGFMRMFLPAALKDNAHMTFACLTGITRVAKESIFSGLNNVYVDSMFGTQFSDYFGFTPPEVEKLLAERGRADRIDQARKWYDGYQFGGQELYNPWSIVSYIDEGCRPGAYWAMTGSNDVIGELLRAADEEVLSQLQALMQGEGIRVMVDMSVSFPHLSDNPSLVFSFLLMAGYLRIASDDLLPDGYRLCELGIPNREIAVAYATEIMGALPGSGAKSATVGIRSALVSGDAESLQAQLEKYLLEVVSYHDASNEAFYHGMVIGMCAAFSGYYAVRSNRESGKGRFDVQLAPQGAGLPGIIIEVKAAKDARGRQLAALAEEAVGQIASQGYATELTSAGVADVTAYGVAFSGKDVAVKIARL